MTAWQDIATAPKNGTRILLVGRDMYGDKDAGEPLSRINIGFWDTEFRNGAWIGLGTHFPPTHWQPLPEPPK